MVVDGIPMSRMRKEAGRAPMLDAAEEAELVARIQRDDDQAALEKLLASHLRMVISLASRYARSGMSDADLVAEGNLGLVEAARRFDASKNVRFSTYAVWWIRARIGRFVLANRRIVSAPSTRNARKLLAHMRDAERRLELEQGERPTRAAVAEATGTSEDDVAMVDMALSVRDVPVGTYEDGAGIDLACETESPEDLLADRQIAERRAEHVIRALALLDGREREIVERRLLEDGEGETLASIGRVLGLSRERVRQIETKAKRKLHAALSSAAAA